MTLAVNQNFVPALHLLADEYLSQVLTKIKKEEKKEKKLEALEYFQKSADKGYIPSLILLGNYYLERNAKLALIYFHTFFRDLDHQNKL